ncbi:transposase zinc-binding domain-containing protein [Halalkalibacter sp. APA_J-10(15)]|uniref:transposase zinc-binding domain-containing protein n=1 Tax=Halalkalibacter sp. APA_J-10(15) TaxID=2933805 RepID=UPI001FF37F99|nr:transposase zinc-binding domain-containing protein [Halalkalibacter sp. APA_J-10(15)]MCK0473365.1 transposase zinc-binding domain-containing protein [Halalkalibacter sp. APA_J-10(15)]
MRKRKSGVVKKFLKSTSMVIGSCTMIVSQRKFRNVKETVEKAMKCGSKDIGFAKYECLGYEGEPRPIFVGFTCKSRFCNKCGKKYTDDWSNKQLIFDVPHRHMVFTIP